MIGIDIITVRFDRKSDLLYGILGKYLFIKNIRVDDPKPNLIDNKGVVEMKNFKLIDTVTLIF